MSSPAERQRAFAAALLDPERPIPAGVVGPDGEPSDRRFAVYRNNVVARLAGVLADTYPVVRRLVGEAFFEAMATRYVRIEPPRSPILIDYGSGFPGFIATFEPAAALPYLADVARIELAWTQAYHAPEAPALAGAAFATVPADDLAFLGLDLHPSLRVVRSAMPVLTIWQMNVGDAEPEELTLDGGGEEALIVRPDAVVEARLLPPGAADFIAALGTGHAIGNAAEIAATCDQRFDLAGSIAGLIEAGAVSAYRAPSIDISVNPRIQP